MHLNNSKKNPNWHQISKELLDKGFSKKANQCKEKYFLLDGKKTLYHIVRSGMSQVQDFFLNYISNMVQSGVELPNLSQI
jgi:hypothetical protein